MKHFDLNHIGYYKFKMQNLIYLAFKSCKYFKAPIEISKRNDKPIQKTYLIYILISGGEAHLCDDVNSAITLTK